jgi:uncharacterized protein
MPKKPTCLSRRNFIKTTATAGIATAFAGSKALGGAEKTNTGPQGNVKPVPTRPFGKTGVDVSILSFGGSQNLVSRQLLLRQALKLGVTYWDTARRYRNSEDGIGKYFSRYPDDRQKVFLVSKTESSIPEDMDRDLAESLDKLKTDYLDLYFVHMVSNVKNDLDKSVQKWAEKAKASGKIRFFGFSTHTNMEGCLLEGAKLGYIDAIMASYNYRLMHSDKMKKAVDACIKAGIGLTAMKTQAPFMARFYATVGKENEIASNMTDQFVKKGFTEEQAKLKVVWDNPQISSICSEMPNMTILLANVAAAAGKTKLTQQETDLLKKYAFETSSQYCAGCADICQSTLAAKMPVADVMRYLMYANGYGELERSRRLFNRIDPGIRRDLVAVDYKMAEKRCPQNLPIARLMQEATEILA